MIKFEKFFYQKIQELGCEIIVLNQFGITI